MTFTPTDAPIDAPTPGEPPPRRSGAVVALLVTLTGVVVLAVLVGQGVVAGLAGSGGLDRANYTADVDGVTAIEIDVSGATLTASFADIPQARLDVEATGWRADVGWTFEVDGDTLVVSDGDRGFWPDFGTRHVVADLVLPEELEGAIDADLELSAGDLSMIGDLGDVVIDVSAGSLTFDGASTGLDAEVSAGNATIDTEGPGTVAVDVSAGRLTATILGDPPTSTTIEVSAGTVVLDLPEAEYALTGDVSAGDRTVDVRTDPGAAQALHVDVSAGSVDIGYSD